jgi:hypothetical protein
MRNQYISDYIHRTTGKRRTAKQVGSRLQQLRETFEGKRREFRFSIFSGKCNLIDARASIEFTHPTL